MAHLNRGRTILQSPSGEGTDWHSLVCCYVYLELESTRLENFDKLHDALKTVVQSCWMESNRPLRSPLCGWRMTSGHNGTLFAQLSGT